MDSRHLLPQSRRRSSTGLERLGLRIRRKGSRHELQSGALDRLRRRTLHCSCG